MLFHSAEAIPLHRNAMEYFYFSGFYFHAVVADDARVRGSCRSGLSHSRQLHALVVSLVYYSFHLCYR